MSYGRHRGGAGSGEDLNSATNADKARSRLHGNSNANSLALRWRAYSIACRTRERSAVDSPSAPSEARGQIARLRLSRNGRPLGV